MNEFNKALENAIFAWIKLSEEWEKIEATHSDKLAEKYPFEKDFREIIFDLQEWKNEINK
ncbi:hypothetical protein COM13_16120 [Bacillus pseudomycoides]|nr:hypothetical protein [Bacillus pseudomycoides]PDX99849.1 hypothetical protein COO07_14380 [Bacillus pseudomycoides]PEK82192.1 hypothetical protein CN597_03720 [Bacillus pseudomycoides]PEN09867.1 hypothetical protein CN640_10470 [Bacillus pseudomycoides]PGB88170.1 hypothetical protein COM13_16120 [Bacillus pseudomycoides]PHG29267.1 hypothetical protein COI43_19060 [Bacillus pseudomycoides]